MNGVAAPLMYVSPNQINFIVPYEVANQIAVTLELSSANGEIARRTLPVTAFNPSLATEGMAEYPVCEGKTVLGGRSGPQCRRNQE